MKRIGDDGSSVKRSASNPREKRTMVPVFCEYLRKQFWGYAGYFGYPFEKRRSGRGNRLFNLFFNKRLSNLWRQEKADLSRTFPLGENLYRRQNVSMVYSFLRVITQNLLRPLRNRYHRAAYITGMYSGPASWIKE